MPKMDRRLRGRPYRAARPAPRRARRHLARTAAVAMLLGAGVAAGLGLIGEQPPTVSVVLGADTPAPAVTAVPVRGDAEASPLPAGPSPVPSPTPSPTPSPLASPTPSPTPPPALPAAAPFDPHPDDVEHEAKRLAGRVAQALTTYGPGADPAAVATAATAQSGGDPAALAVAAAALVHPDVQSTGIVVYPQLGGLKSDKTSVMVVVRQTLMTADGTVREETRTLDVRLWRTSGAWQLDHLASDGGPVTERPAVLPPEAARVLDHPRIALPDSARWDIQRGQVGTGLLTALADIGDRHDIGIAVLVTGHPATVFGTDRISRHTKGRAFDVYAVDGELVASGRHDGSVTHGLSRWLYDTGIPELGSPWAFTGGGMGKSFTDAVHQDHIHVGVDA